MARIKIFMVSVGFPDGRKVKCEIAAERAAVALARAVDSTDSFGCSFEDVSMHWPSRGKVQLAVCKDAGEVQISIRQIGSIKRWRDHETRVWDATDEVDSDSTEAAP